MSIFRWTALLAFCCICTACGGSDDTPAPVLSTEQVAGIWKLKSWTGEAQNPDGTSYTFSDVVYVYVELHEDNTYALYQNVSAVGAVKFTGSYSLEASTIRGFYSTSAGSKAWSDSYEIGNLSGSAMTWTASHAAGDVQQFVRVETVPPGGARRLGRSALRRRTDVGRHLVGDNGRFGKTGSGLPGSGPVHLLRHTTGRLFLRTIGQAGGLPCADANE